MVRVHRRGRLSAAPTAAARHTRSLQEKTKAPYKVVFEQVTEKKKKLITVLTFSAKAPPGYTFIPAGDPSITTRCKDLAREDKLKVYIVSASKNKHNLSHEVHRIGYHFPSLVVEKACMSLGVSLSVSGFVLPTNTRRPNNRFSRKGLLKGKEIKKADKIPDNISQATLNNQAREAIKDLFPKIPDKDLHAIVNRAFQKGKARVGTAPELSLPRRVQLAVVAHIRHVYTNYDRLLKTGTYHEARAAIEKPCLDLLAQWRSDDDDDPNAMEEILREVIVIDDDDDEEDDIIETPPTQYHSVRDDSVEIISSHAFADEVELHAIDYGDSNQAIDRDRAYSPELDRRAIMQYPGSGRYRDSQQQHQNGSTSLDRSDIHQLRWQEALYRRRKNSMSMLIDGPLMQETKTSTSHALQSEARAQRPYLKDQQRQLLDYGSGTGMLSRGPFHNKSSALPGDENTSNQVMGIIKQRVNEIPPRPRQMIISSQELRNTPRDIVDTSHRAKEDYISSGRSKSDRFQLIPLEEQNVLKRDQQAEQGFRDISHWPDQLAPIRKSERILPSIEENVQDPKYRHDKTNSSGEHSPRYLNDHSSFNRGIQGRPRIIKLDKEMNIERSRLDALALMSPEGKQHLSHDNRQGGTIFVPLRTRTMADIHQQHIQPEAFPREERVVYLRPVDAQRSEKQVPRPMPQYQIDDMGYQRQILDDPQTRFMHHEQSQASILSASSREQVHDFLRPAIREERLSSPFSKSRDANKHVSLSHIPFTSHGSSRHSDVYLASDVRFLGAVEGIEKTLILPEKRIDRFQNSPEPNYRRVCIEKDQNFNEVDRINRKSSNNQIQVPVYERSRTGIFIRRIHDGQQVSSDNTSQHQPEPRLHQNMVSFPVQNSEEVIYHNNLDIPQNHLLTMQAGKVNPMQSLPRRYDNPRQSLDQENTRHACPREVSPSNLRKRAGTTELLRGPTYADPSLWDQRRQQDVIVID